MNSAKEQRMRLVGDPPPDQEGGGGQAVGGQALRWTWEKLRGEAASTVLNLDLITLLDRP